MRTILLIFFLFSYSILTAQNTPLMVLLDNEQKPYLNHTIGVKENFYSIGRAYNISPRIFAPYNGMELTSGLSVGQTIRIPLNEANFWQTGSRKSNETVVAVYHQVQTKETLTSISKLYKVDKASLISWNNLIGEKINTGDKIIIGFLKVDKNLSPLAAQGVGPRSEPTYPKIDTSWKKQKQAAPVEIKKEEKNINKPATEKSNQDTPPLKEQSKTEVKQPVPLSPRPADDTVTEYKGSGYFMDEFNNQTNNGKRIQSSKLNGGFFKSTSGWSDGKYYILIDNIEKGTIVQLINPANNKKVFAKVLASIAETKPGATESFLVSNATATQLGVKGNNFELEISWEK
ncbi:MAG: LysM peptidoglycan-binding domain-containing protein [Bacteroidota bacterium]